MFIITIFVLRLQTIRITGFWEADDVFKEQAGLSEFYMYIGDKNGTATAGKNAYPSYILMMDSNENILMNKPLICNISQRWNRKWVLNCDDFEGIMPSNMTMEFNSSDNIIELFSGDTLHAKFIKNNKLSHVCKPNVRNAVQNIINDESDGDEDEEHDDEDVM